MSLPPLGLLSAFSLPPQFLCILFLHFYSWSEDFSPKQNNLFWPSSPSIVLLKKKNFFFLASAVVFLQFHCFPSFSHPLCHLEINVFIFSSFLYSWFPRESSWRYWADVSCLIVRHPLSPWWPGPCAVLPVSLLIYCVSGTSSFSTHM